ncbi:uncharacterized protein LOC132383601 [Hypanus sabinus]|uniref:uncharacterized protein LOC132383601 n=1 Tax=Hypanus sabinus TaxID=79690 RepID=UPI0028C4213E|nr:uncharacterized protein LOC132383601 [Hypanus sabinus]
MNITVETRPSISGKQTPTQSFRQAWLDLTQLDIFQVPGKTICILVHLGVSDVEVKNMDVAARKSSPPTSNQVLCLTVANMRRTLCRVNPRKAAGPDNITGRVLRGCADQLADVLTDIFSISLSSATVSMCFKTTTIIPVPKKSSVSCLNDYRPVALTSIIMKCFERLVMRHIKTLLPTTLDPLQSAYRPNHSTDDAIATTPHLALTHLDKKGHIRSDAIHRLQFSVQHNHPSESD